MLDHDNIVWMKWGTPFFRGPFTDLFLHVRNVQCMKECAPYELMFMDCMEAYGYHKGKEKCRLILDDMFECIYKNKRILRVYKMEEERQRQFKSGERKNRYEETPPLDLY
ncbi:uncharacterized protein LOC105206452 [Solenopsis invicta]|uniref:uncharacterized protein LOC105206452 n=1 Tax=Solenopsis invicta TaxID=13686 RepID=UPI00059595E1|nr:uncharacterized protein LOC105206452 [Solenopsis invicta]